MLLPGVFLLLDVSIIQRPNLFAADKCGDPLLDMPRYRVDGEHSAGLSVEQEIPDGTGQSAFFGSKQDKRTNKSNR
jgi:hypothetical protein